MASWIRTAATEESHAARQAVKLGGAVSYAAVSEIDRYVTHEYGDVKKSLVKVSPGGLVLLLVLALPRLVTSANRRSPFTHSGSIRPMFQYCEQGPIQLRWARGPLP